MTPFMTPLKPGDQIMMTRRQAIKTTALASAAFATLPGALAQSTTTTLPGAAAQESPPIKLGQPLITTAGSGPFTLPPLPYAFDALEPHIDARTMEIHHDKHHAAYVANLNKAIADRSELRKFLQRQNQVHRSGDESVRKWLGMARDRFRRGVES